MEVSWLAFCRPPQAAVVDPALAVLAEHERALEDEIAALELALLQRPVCPVPPAPPAPAEPVQRADIPEADIPEETWQARDVSFLDGCWQLDARMTFRWEQDGVRTGEADTTGWYMCFDGQGRGEQVLTFEGGHECRVGLESRFLDDGRLKIADVGVQDCGDATFTPYPQTKSCERLNDREAACRWSVHRPDGSIEPQGRVTFRRSA